MFKRLISYLRTSSDRIIISYKSLRRLIGILGILLPFICMLGGWLFARDPVQPSISLYYYTNMRDFLVGLLFVVSLFLMTYKGTYKIDMVVTTITGIAGLCVALFPCYNEALEEQRVGLFQLYPETSNVVHLTFAAIFFLLLAINSYFLFTRMLDAVTPQKLKRNIIYRVCGIVIFICLIGLFASMIIFSPEQRASSRIVLILETIALLAFGVSWLVKGQTIWPDRVAPAST